MPSQCHLGEHLDMSFYIEMMFIEWFFSASYVIALGFFESQHMVLCLFGSIERQCWNMGL